MVGPHPDTRSYADIQWQFQRNCTSASAPAPASGYPSAAAGILGYPPSKGPATDRLEGFPSSRRGTCTSTRYMYLDKVHVPRRLEGCPSSRRGTSTSPAGRVSFQSTRYMYLAGWKGVLPVDEVHVPAVGRYATLRFWPKKRSVAALFLRQKFVVVVGPFLRPTRVALAVSWRNSATLRLTLTGIPLRYATLTATVSVAAHRCMYLVGWKETLPAVEVLVPRRLEGNPSSQRGTCTLSAGRKPFQPSRYLCLAGWKGFLPAGRGYPLGYPDTRQQFAEKGPSAPAGGYPLAQAGIRQRITGIRNGYPSTISTHRGIQEIPSSEAQIETLHT
ncbi:hypothetical protein PGTUg99_008209 [Puccinia graminis f. sp. tritici]|uniref:Uncharacterized protein n=1 Tax=Puccinia graminis f. sp. tritici TaxID=56615 RepID=A0A5B0QLC2_PUCGR|nr:hypothetical protein PGTUg99_008209 [Puccinia graminis f. sp. tritici]